MTPTTDPIVGKFVRFSRVRNSSFLSLTLNWTVLMKTGSPLLATGYFLFPDGPTSKEVGLQILEILTGAVNVSGRSPLEPDWYDQAASAVAEALPVIASTANVDLLLTNADVPGRWTAGLV